MTKYWGPLGWMTLHSISACYPDNPNVYERELVSQWFSFFKDTLVCPSCQQHFEEMFSGYVKRNPNWNASRKNLLEFVFRAHNTVNTRIHKKIYSFTEGIAELKRILPENTAVSKRREYLVYIRADWMRNMTLQAISNAPKLKELYNIEDSYWSTRTFVWDDLLQFSDINTSPILHSLSVLNSTPNIPKIVAPTKPFSIIKNGKFGRLSSLR
ncbi:hypothetical protein EB118_04005 [bacterium]|nr:hypothetical protein [Actinomycetota bacterium]NDG29250.1 hypothetical protein [bacterium]